MAIIKVLMKNDCRLMEVNSSIDMDELVAQVTQAFNLEKGSVDLRLAEDQSKGAKFEVRMKHDENGKEYSKNGPTVPEISEVTFNAAVQQLKEIHGLDVTVEDMKIMASALKLGKNRFDKLMRSKSRGGTADGSGEDCDLMSRGQRNSDCSESSDTDAEEGGCDCAGPHFRGQLGPHGHGPHVYGPHGPHSHGPHSHGPHGLGPHGHGPHRLGAHDLGPYDLGLDSHGLGPHGHGPRGLGAHGLSPGGHGPPGHGPRGQGPRGHGPRDHGPRGHGPRSHGSHGHGPHGHGPHGHGPHGLGPRSQGPHGRGPHDHGPRAAKMKMAVNTLHERGVKLPGPALRQVLRLMHVRPRHVEKALMN